MVCFFYVGLWRGDLAPHCSVSIAAWPYGFSVKSASTSIRNNDWFCSQAICIYLLSPTYQPPSTWQPTIAPAAAPTGTPTHRPCFLDSAAPSPAPSSPPITPPSTQLLLSTSTALGSCVGACDGLFAQAISTFSVQLRTYPGLSFVPGTYSSLYSSRKHCVVRE